MQVAGNKPWQLLKVPPQADRRSVCVLRTTVGQHLVIVTDRSVAGKPTFSELLTIGNDAVTITKHFNRYRASRGSLGDS